MIIQITNVAKVEVAEPPMKEYCRFPGGWISLCYNKASKRKLIMTNVARRAKAWWRRRESSLHLIQQIKGFTGSYRMFTE